MTEKGLTISSRWASEIEPGYLALFSDYTRRNNVNTEPTQFCLQINAKLFTTLVKVLLP